MQILELMKSLIPTIEMLWQAKTVTAARQCAFELAKEHTKRTRLLVLGDPANLNPYEELQGTLDMEVIPAGKAAQLCEAIACSSERIAAIVVKYHQSSPYYYKKVRELASAEGAVMIWDESDKVFSKSTIHTHLSRNIPPDIFCFSLTKKKPVWIGGKENILQESNNEYRK